MKEAVWTNGKRRVTGRWEYLWQSDRFRIELDQRDSTTGQPKRFTVTGESPEWGNWRREQPNQP
jgi:hypothetical protein